MRVLYHPLHGQPHTVFGGFLFTSTGWTLTLKDRIMAEDSPHTAMQIIQRFNVALVFVPSALCPCVAKSSGLFQKPQWGYRKEHQ